MLSIRRIAYFGLNCKRTIYHKAYCRVHFEIGLIYTPEITSADGFFSVLVLVKVGRVKGTPMILGSQYEPEEGLHSLSFWGE